MHSRIHGRWAQVMAIQKLNTLFLQDEPPNCWLEPARSHLMRRRVGPSRVRRRGSGCSTAWREGATAFGSQFDVRIERERERARTRKDVLSASGLLL